MEQPQKSAPKPVPQSGRNLRFGSQRWIIERKLLYRVFQFGVFVGFYGVDTRKNERRDPLESFYGVFAFARSGKQRIAHFRIGHVFQPRHHIAYFSFVQYAAGVVFWGEESHFGRFYIQTGMNES